MRAGAEGIAIGIKKDGNHEHQVTGRKIKNQEGDDVKHKGRDHGAAAPHAVGQHTGWNFKDVDGDFLDGIQGSYFEEGKPFA